MHSVTASYTNNKYYDVIICKWEINHYGNQTQANTDCKNMNYLGLESTGKIQIYPQNDQAMLTKYIDSSVCGRLLSI